MSQLAIAYGINLTSYIYNIKYDKFIQKFSIAQPDHSWLAMFGRSQTIDLIYLFNIDKASLLKAFLSFRLILVWRVAYIDLTDQGWHNIFAVVIHHELNILVLDAPYLSMQISTCMCSTELQRFIREEFNDGRAMGRSRRRSMGRWCQLLSAPDHHQSWCGH
jgi:hypothetical protein